MPLTKMPQMTSVMTPFPYSVELENSLDDARRLMNDHGIHHLPVKRGGELVGVLSYRDLELRLDRGDEPSGGRPLRVTDAHVQQAHVFDLHTRVDEVAEHMADTRSDAVIVTREGRLAGIFTATDACRWLAEILSERFPPDDEDQIA